MSDLQIVNQGCAVNFRIMQGKYIEKGAIIKKSQINSAKLC